MAQLIHYQGEGKGYMTGVHDYVIVLDDDQAPEHWCAAGFAVASNTKIPDPPPGFPWEKTLIGE